MRTDELNAIADAVAERLRTFGVQEPISINEREASKLLSLSVRTLYTLRKSGEIPHTIIGERVLYSPTELRAWFAEKRHSQKIPRCQSSETATGIH